MQAEREGDMQHSLGGSIGVSAPGRLECEDVPGREQPDKKNAKV